MEASPACAELAHASSHVFLAARSPSLSGNWVRLAKSCYTQISVCIAGAGKGCMGAFKLVWRAPKPGVQIWPLFLAAIERF